jgi:hypothetical protein
MRKKATGSVLTKGLAGAAALAGATQAYGTIVVVNLPANIAGNDPAAGSATPINRLIDVDGNGTMDLRISYRSFVTGGYVLQQSFVFSMTGQTAAYGPVGAQDQYYAYRLAAGDAIPGTNQFAQNTSNFLTHIVTNVDGNEYGLWSLGDRGFVGFSFLNASNQLDFGYIELQTNAWTGPGTIGVQFFSLAYETSGGPIVAGAVPEPSTLAALAFGGVGLAAAAYRRRKKS